MDDDDARAGRPGEPDGGRHDHRYLDLFDDPCLHLDVVGDGLALVASIRALGADHVLVLVGPDRLVIGAVTDPCEAMLAGLGRLTDAGLGAPVHHVLLVSRRCTGWDPPTPVDVAEFLTRRAHVEAQGVGLLDWVHVDAHAGSFRSLALVVDEAEAFRRPRPRLR